MERAERAVDVADVQKIEIIALKTQVEAMKARAGRCQQRTEGGGRTPRDVERALSERQSRLAKLIDELDDRSTLADAQKIEIIALETE